jgi:PBSX family phage terminase large subunit
MRLQELSPKQRDFLLNSDARINIACGAVRSGKTIVSILKWLHIVALAPEGSGLLMIAKTERTLRRNILDVVYEMVGPEDFRLNSGLGECWIYGKRVYLVGANDERAENKIRGITLYAAYLDEATLCPESFFQMLLSRLSEPNSILIATTNPDSPAHYIKKNWIDRGEEVKLKYWHFTLEDNYTLDSAFVEAIYKQYVGLWRKRFAYGLWVTAEGAIYNFLSDDPKDGYVVDILPDDLSRFIVSIDYGQVHPCAMGLFGYSQSKKCWYLIKEHYTNNKPNTEYVKEFNHEMLIWNGKSIIPEYVDVDAGGGGLSLIQDLRAAHPKMNIRYAIKVDVVKEIQDLSSALYNSKIKIYVRCKRVISEMLNYVWDTKSSEQGKEEPIKKNDDGPDFMRYGQNRIRQSLRNTING